MGERDGAPRGETILVVDDEPGVREILRLVLEERGYHVLEAAGAAEAIETAAACGSGVDLLVTDLLMPGMGGRELADRLRVLSPALKILFVTGHAPERLAPDPALPAAGVIEKPFSLSLLTGRIRTLLDE
ncbi:MAG: response regulator [Acidobacteria bacterium]|nr:response regulator [Acidobacteriota bacterium]